MKRFRYYPQLLLAVVAVICVIAALFTTESISASALLCRHFELISQAIRSIHEGGNEVGAWCLYIFIGVLPLIIPVVICGVRHRFCPHSLIWIALSVSTFTIVYLCINRQIFSSDMIASDGEYYVLVVDALCFIWLGVAVMCVFAECGYALKANSASYYVLGQILVYFLALVGIINAFYISLSGAVYDTSLLKNTGLPEEALRLNVLSIAMPVVAECLSTVAGVIFLSTVGQLLNQLKRDALSKRSIKLLKYSAIFGKISIITTIVTALISNVIVLATVKQLVSIHFAVIIPLYTLLSVCLTMIAIELLKRSIAVDEENKLTI